MNCRYNILILTVSILKKKRKFHFGFPNRKLSINLKKISAVHQTQVLWVSTSAIIFAQYNRWMKNIIAVYNSASLIVSRDLIKLVWVKLYKKLINYTERNDRSSRSIRESKKSNPASFWSKLLIRRESWQMGVSTRSSRKAVYAIS